MKCVLPLPVLLALLLATTVRATEVADLLAAQRLELGTSLAPAEPVVPGQRVSLYIDVATDRWFAGGTRIQVPEVPGLIVLQTQSFASNSSELRSGQNWVIQRWSLDVYATRAGSFSTGPIPLDIEVSTEDGVARGRVLAPAVTLQAQQPPGVATSNWVASPEFSASQSLDPETTQLKPGDAISRRILLEASDVLDKMLPAVTDSDRPGLAAYPQPPRLSMQSNRGDVSARREQVITYVAEQAGDYTLPAYEFAWWDTAAGRLRMVTLDAVSLTVSGAAPAPDTPSAASPLRNALPALALALGLLLVGLAAWRWLPWRPLAQGAMAGLRAGQAAWRRWRAPGLPSRLNPWR